MGFTPPNTLIIAEILRRIRLIDPVTDARFNYKVNGAGERPEEFDPAAFEITNGKTQVFIQTGKLTINEDATGGTLAFEQELLLVACRAEDPKTGAFNDGRGVVARALGEDILYCLMKSWRLNEGGTGEALINDNLQPVEMRHGVSRGVAMASLFLIAKYVEAGYADEAD